MSIAIKKDSETDVCWSYKMVLILKSTRMTKTLKRLKKGPEQQNIVRAQYQL